MLNKICKDVVGFYFLEQGHYGSDSNRQTRARIDNAFKDSLFVLSSKELEVEDVIGNEELTSEDLEDDFVSFPSRSLNYQFS